MITATDLFCGAGGSSLGAEAAGVRLAMAANHWATAIDVHQTHFPDAGHDCADVSQADPRRYPRTTILLASPECTNHSNARGISRRRQDPSLWDAPDPAAERSRATMWDVPRFAEQMGYEAVIVENVVEATKWALWPAWWQAMELLGYHGQVVSANSQDFGVPQSRDRIYVVWWRGGAATAPDLTQTRVAWCVACDAVTTCVQRFNPGRHTGRYRQQWHWYCQNCYVRVQPDRRGAVEIIDWALPISTIGERARPLAEKSRARIRAGMHKYGWIPDPADTSTAAQPGFMVQTAHGARVHGLEHPHPTVCASDDRLSLVVQMRGTHDSAINGSLRPSAEPLGTVSAGGSHHALIVRHMDSGGNGASLTRPVTDPLSTVLAAAPNQTLVVPYYGRSVPQPASRPLGTVTTRDAAGIVTRGEGPTVDEMIDACGFRMLEPHETAAAMAFPVGYIPRGLTKRDQVKLAGNAVTPPVAEWIVRRVVAALERRL